MRAQKKEYNVCMNKKTKVAKTTQKKAKSDVSSREQFAKKAGKAVHKAAKKGAEIVEAIQDAAKIGGDVATAIEKDLK